MALVIDASALSYCLLVRSPQARIVRQRLADEVCHAPHLVDAEVGNVLRRRVLRRQLTANEAEYLLVEGAALIDHRHEMTGELAKPAWALRENVSFYDGLYVALAAALYVTLLTADERLTRAPGLNCPVERVGGLSKP